MARKARWLSVALKVIVSTLDLRNIAKSNFSAQWLSADNKKSHSLF